MSSTVVAARVAGSGSLFWVSAAANSTGVCIVGISCGTAAAARGASPGSGGGGSKTGEGGTFSSAVGAAASAGGYGSAVGAALGALIFGTVQMGIFFTGVNTDWFKVFVGALVLIAVLFNNFIRRRVTEAR